MKFAHVIRLVLVCCMLPLQSLASQANTLRAAVLRAEASILDMDNTMNNNAASFTDHMRGKGGDLPRPNDGGAADVIQFRMFLREFMGLSETKGTIMYDLVLSYAWDDQRIVSLIPEGKETANIPVTTPTSVMWNPKVVVTSRDFNGLDYIAQTIEINKAGKALEVQRFLYAGKNKFAVEQFPFDKQTLTVLITSGAYMMEDVEFTVIPGMAAAGVGPVAFQDRPFTVANTSTWEFKEVSGPLRKSRGRFDVVVQRKWAGPLKKLGTPQLLLLLQAYSVFFIPIEPFAMMPRVATCLIAFLALMAVQGAQQMPPAAGPSWLELFNGTIMMLILGSLVFNGLIHLIAWSWKDMPLANKANQECRIIFGALAALMLFVVVVGSTGVFLGELNTFNSAAMLVTVIGYIAYRNLAFMNAQKAAAAAAAAKAAAETAK